MKLKDYLDGAPALFEASVGFTQDTSREILDLLTRLYKAGKISR